METRNLIMFSMILLVLLAGCSQGEETASTITLDSETSIPAESCKERGLSNKIIMLESEHCGHCKMAEPILKEIEQEKGLDFEFLDVSKEDDRAVMESYGVSIMYTPTLLAGCSVYIGSKTKEEYQEIINTFIEAR
ncbi:thioredoxin family protein [Candidatus Woesearchaeota archaeon]|nr:thioredoxin family protein [Candidatus Woesearchaeota archaeon]